MMRMAKLSPEQIALNLSKIPGWIVDDSGAIVRRIRFSQFREALEFVNHVGRFAEDANHHPDITIQYGQVTLRLFTHDRGGLTGKDFALAQKINQIPNASKVI